MKDEYRKRFLERGNTQNFLDVFIWRWDLFMDHLEPDPCEQKVILSCGVSIGLFWDIKRLRRCIFCIAFYNEIGGTGITGSGRTVTGTE